MADSRVTERLPHRPPFLWVDSIVLEEADRIITRKYVAPDLSLFTGHYPDYPLLPGVLLCEAAFQSGALLLAGALRDTKEGQLPVVTRIQQARFKREVRPGDTLEIEVRLVERLGAAWFMKAKIRVAKKLAAAVDFSCTMKENTVQG